MSASPSLTSNVINLYRIGAKAPTDPDGSIKQEYGEVFVTRCELSISPCGAWVMLYVRPRRLPDGFKRGLERAILQHPH